MTWSALRFRHVVVHVVIQSTSVDETALFISWRGLEMNSKPPKAVSVDEAALISGP